MGSTLTVAKAYLTAFAAKDIDKLAGFFADKFRFDGPMMQFDSADAFTGIGSSRPQALTEKRADGTGGIHHPGDVRR